MRVALIAALQLGAPEAEAWESAETREPAWAECPPSLSRPEVLREFATPKERGPRLAWQERQVLLTPGGRPELGEQFIVLIRSHARNSISVPDVAQVLGICETALKRMVRRQFAYSPAVLLGLAKSVSLAMDIVTTSRSLKEIAYQH